MASQSPFAEDAAREKDMERGSFELARAIAGRNPFPTSKELRWSTPDGGNKQDPNARSRDIERRVLERMERKDAIAERQRTYRDPCPRCGVRADIGCKHTAAVAANILSNRRHVNRAWDEAIDAARAEHGFPDVVEGK